MEFKTLEQLISDTATQKAIDKSTIIEDLADILKVKYSVSIMDKERDIIDEVKTKVITKLYNTDNNNINNTHFIRDDCTVIVGHLGHSVWYPSAPRSVSG